MTSRARDTCPLSISTFSSILHLEGKIARAVYKYTYKCLLSLISKESQCVFNKSVFLISLVFFLRITLRFHATVTSRSILSPVTIFRRSLNLAKRITIGTSNIDQLSVSLLSTEKSRYFPDRKLKSKTKSLQQWELFGTDQSYIARSE